MKPPLFGKGTSRPLGFLASLAVTPPASKRIPERHEAALLFSPTPSRPAVMPRPQVAAPRPAATSRASTFGHLIVIPTQNRPELLGRCVESIADNMRRFGYRQKIRIVVVDDSTEKKFEKSNREALTRLAKRYSHLFDIVHYDRATQNKFVADLEAKSRTKLDAFIFPDASKVKHGFGGARNLASLIALRHAEPSDLITFFDDDITLENLHLKRHEGKVVPAVGHLFSFFHKVDQVFSNANVKIASGRVTKDIKEPQQLIPDFLDKANLFLERAKSCKPDEKLGALAEQVTDVPELGQNVPFGRALRLLSVYSQGVTRRGAFNASLRYYDSNAPIIEEMKRTVSLGGANVTIRADTLANGVPYPTADIRGEDTTWSMLMHRLLGGGIYRMNLPVLHHKGGSRAVFKEYGQSISFLPVYEVIKGISHASSQSHLARQVRLNASPHAINLGHRRILSQISSEFERWNASAHSASRNLASSRGWWHSDPKLKSAASRLGKSIALFTSKKREQIYSSVVPPDKMHAGLTKYADLIERWPTVLAAVKGTRFAKPLS